MNKNGETTTMINYWINKIFGNKLVAVGATGALAMALAFAVVGVGAQSPSQGPAQAAQPTKAAKASVTPDPLAITADEIKRFQAIQADAKPFQDEARASYQRLTTAKTSSERCAAATEHVLALSQLQPISVREQQWIADVRRAHNCEGCEIVEGKLVRPTKEAASQSNDK